MLEQLQLRTDAKPGDGLTSPSGVELLLRCKQRPGAHFIRLPQDEDRWLYATLMLARKLGEPTYQTLHQRIESVRGEERFGMEALAPAGRSVWLQEGAPAVDGEATDVHDVADRDAAWWFERQSTIGGVADSGRNVEPVDADMRPLWRAVEADPRRFALAYAGGLLGVRVPRGGLGFHENELIRAKAVVDRLRDKERWLLSRLRVHRRPLPIEIFNAAFPDDVDALGRLRALGIVDTLDDDILFGPPWTLAPLEAPEVAVHRDLAGAFAALVNDADRSLSVRGLSALEAQRHYSRCDDPEAWHKALLRATYGVRSVLQTAVGLSKEGDPARARQLYRALLDAHREAAPRPLLGRRAHAYAIHYEAENRRRSEHPGVSAAVMTGFRESLRLWPENAHFWGDSIFALALRGDIEGARASREQAFASVDRTHPGSVEHIVRRPVARLTGPHLWKAFGLAMVLPEAPLHMLSRV